MTAKSGLQLGLEGILCNFWIWASSDVHLQTHLAPGGLVERREGEEDC